MLRKFTYLLLQLLIVASVQLQAQDSFLEDSLLTVYRGSRNVEVKVQALIELAQLKEAASRKESLDYAHLAVETARDESSQISLGRALENLGLIYIRSGDYDKATGHLLDARKIMEEQENLQLLVGITSNLGAVRYFLEDLEGALAYFQEALDLNARLLEDGDSTYMNRMHGFYINVGSIHLRRDEQETAAAYMQKAMSWAQNENDVQGVGRSANKLGEVYLMMGERSKAKQYMELGLSNLKTIQDNRGLIQSYLILARYHLEGEHSDSALFWNHEAVLLGEKLGIPDLLRDAYEQKAAICEKHGRFENANKALRAYYAMRDSLQNEQIQSRSLRMEMKYEIDKLEEARNMENYRARIRLITHSGVLAGILVIFILLFILYRNRSRRIQSEKEALESNLEIRNKELTTKVLYLIRKNESIMDITARLNGLLAQLKEENKAPLRQVIRDLQTATDQDSWKEFELRFQQVHTAFFSDLQKDFPDLSPGELKICAFLRLNMSTKEISSITNQAVKSLEVSRSRIRKKLKLTGSDESLVNFLSRY